MPLPIRPAARSRLLAVATLALCTLSVISPGTLQDRVRTAAHAGLRPVLGLFALARTGLLRALDRFDALLASADEVRRLREENRALREALAAQTERTGHATARLRDYQGFEAFRERSLDRPLRIIPANILAADTSSWRHSFVIDRGAGHGVRLGSPAVWGSSIVGTVIALRSSVATVRCLTDHRSGLKVRVEPSHAVGLLRGVSERGGRLELAWLHLGPAEVGDRVLTSGQDPLIPSGLVAGEVVSASKTRKPHFYEVQVRPLLDFDRLSELLIVVYPPSELEQLLEEQARPAR